MTRKSKRLAINEAIRQGQAKIAEGLKSGKMRSDGLPEGTGTADKKGITGPKISGVEFFRSEDWSRNRIGLYFKSIPTVLLYAGAVVILALGIWLLLAIFGSDQPVTNENEVARNSTDKVPANDLGSAGTEEAEKKRFGLFETDPKASSESKEAIDASEVSKGDNVIWIQSIASSRKDELVSVAEFFGRKGIETEIIIHRNSGDAILVTKAGFEENPAKKGTTGYALLQQIKQLGPVYVEETSDTKFGVKPFQSELGYKR